MKYIVLTTIALMVCFGLSFLIAFSLRRFFGQSRKRLKMITATVLIGLILIAILAFSYLSIYSHAGEPAQQAMLGNALVVVKEIDGGYFFDGPSDTNAIIFYPGAKVDSVAYAPLMLKLAESGFDCFLAEMPFHFALFGSNTADLFLDAYSYDTWIMAGHSMGGMVAASYANAHTEKIDGVILLAAYATEKIDDRQTLCSVYGDADTCLEADVYQDCKSCWPEKAQETVINGGNHSQFADYGLQKGDGIASITAEKQTAVTVSAIVSCFE